MDKIELMPIDWEQRRYEIAKDLYIALFQKNEFLKSMELASKAAVDMANALILELKNTNNITNESKH